jgi:superfamily II RNA helicase
MIPQQAGIYHTTSVDAAKSNHTTLSLAGQKRTYGGFRDKESQRDAPVLVNIINTAGFQRPTVYEENNLATIEPGKVKDVGARDQSIYSQRRSLALTPTVASNPLLDLSHPAYGLPKQLVDNFASVGIKSIYPWQSECLLKSGALRGERNLVYTAPTGGGKSLVADILMLKHVIDIPGKKAILVLPYVALVQEKMRWLRKVVEGILKTTASSLGEHRTSGWRKRGDEDTVVNAAIEDLSIGKLGVVVMDELHMIDDESRGYILELMATKLLSLEQEVQIIGEFNQEDVLGTCP